MNSRRVIRLGAAALGVYLAVAAATLALSGRRLLPLFEGIGPPAPYQWVNPPPAFKSGNIRPAPASVDFSFRSGRSAPTSAFTPDSQFVINISEGAFASHGADTGVRVVMTPVDPATLAPLPAGLFADGNAYRLQFSYQPSNTAIDAVAGQGSLSLAVPNPAQALLYSPEGRSWTKLASQSIAATSTVLSSFSRPGWYLAGAGPTAVTRGSSNHLGTATVAVLVAALAILLTAGPRFVRALRRRRSAPRAQPDPDPGPPPTKPPSRSRRR